MPFARVAIWEGVSSESMAAIKQQIEGSERPANVPASEIIVLHDPGSEKSLALVFFENEADYRLGDEALSAMPANEAAGTRTSVAKYEVAVRVTT